VRPADDSSHDERRPRRPARQQPGDGNRRRERLARHWQGAGIARGRYVNWLTIADNAASVVEDVKRIKAHPLVPKYIPVYGYIYDCKTGRLVEVRRRPRQARRADDGPG